MYYDLWDRVDWHNRTFSWEKLACVLFGFIIGISFSVWAWQNTDKTPATPEDYAELHARLEALQTNPYDFFKNDGDIKVSDGIITYEVSNDECKMTGKFNQDFKLIETTQVDKSPSTFKLICFIIICFIFLAFIAGGLLNLIIIVVEHIVITIIVVTKKIKRKFKK